MGRSAQKTKHLRSRRACPFPSTCSIKKVWVDGLDKCLNWEPAGRPISFMSTSVQSFVVLFCELSDQLTLRIEASGWWLVRDGAWRSKLGFPLRSHGCSFHLRGRSHCPCFARKCIAFRVLRARGYGILGLGRWLGASAITLFAFEVAATLCKPHMQTTHVCSDCKPTHV